MDAIYSATALRDRSTEVKQVAKSKVVRITENGNGAYVFCSEEVFEREIEEAVERARYASNAERAIERGLADYRAGNYVEGIDAAKIEVSARRSKHD